MGGAFLSCFSVKPSTGLQDAFVKKAMKRITQHVMEKDLWVDGEFVSEEDMREELKLKESLGSDV